MKKIVFTPAPGSFYPFTLTRPVQELRTGILTIREKWERALDLPTEEDPADEETGDRELRYLIPANLLPTPSLLKQVKKLRAGDVLCRPDGSALLHCLRQEDRSLPAAQWIHRRLEAAGSPFELSHPWDLFRQNARALELDFDLLTKGKRSQKLSSTNRTVRPGRIFLEKGAQVEHCILNASEGPIYIGRDALVMEGSLLRGPLSIGARSVVKMGTRIYGATTVGPSCSVGGEIKNSVLFGFSNKAHDGYLGDSVVGEWCNMGAGTSNSNVKNNASLVVAQTPEGRVELGWKCGMLMGDYSRTAINTSINTGTIIGVSCNVFSKGLTPKSIPSFSWGDAGTEPYRFEKALEDIANWKRMKGQELQDDEKKILKHIFDRITPERI